MGNSRNLGILLCHAFGGVDHDQHHVGPLYRRYRTDNAVAFQFFLNLVLPAKAGRVYEYIFLSIVHDICVDSIPGRSRDIRYDDALLSQ